MKFCVTDRVRDEILQKADEIKVRASNFERLAAKELKAQFLLDYQDFLTISATALPLDNVIWRASKIEDCQALSSAGRKFYWGYPLTSFFELQMIAALHPTYVLLGAPLFFSLIKVREVLNGISPETEIRLCANNPFPFGLHCALPNICSAFVRPEDIYIYDHYAQVIEFLTENPKQEEALFTIYTEDSKWNDNFRFISKDLDFDNTLIPSGFAEYRIFCEQKCMKGERCKFCPNSIINSSHIRRMNSIRTAQRSSEQGAAT